MCIANPTRIRAKSMAVLLGTAASWSIASSQAMAAAPVDASKDSSTSEIVVTARRRTESVEKVPITVTVLNGNQLKLEGISRPQDIQFTVPGLDFESYESGQRVSLRGIGSDLIGIGAESPVAVHIDGVFQTFSGGAFSRLFDVDHIEVLRGPQGTLYGRNSTAGAINVISTAPGHTFGGDGQISFGSFNSVKTDAAVNLPIDDNTAIRVAAATGNSDGYTKNLDGGPNPDSVDWRGVRARLVSTDISRLKLDAVVQYVQDDSGQALINNPISASPHKAGYYSTYIDNPNYSHQRDLNARLQLDYSLNEDWTLRSITGYGGHDGHNANDADLNPPGPGAGIPLTFDDRVNEITQELQGIYANPGTGTNLVFGGYFLNSKGIEHRVIDVILSPTFTFHDENAHYIDETRSYAAFGELNQYLTPKLRLNAGLRYNYEHREGSGVDPDVPLPFTSAEKSWSNVSGRLGLDYFVPTGGMIYSSIATGFKAGGVVVLSTAVDPVNTYNPETVTSYEVGYKQPLKRLDGYINFSAFYNDYKNLQVSSGFFDVSSGAFASLTENAASAHTDGLDIDGRVRLAPHFAVEASVEFLDAKFDKFISEQFNSTTKQVFFADFSNHRLPRAPKFSSSIAAVFDKIPVSTWGLGTVRVEYNYKSDQFYTQANKSTDFQSALGLVNITARVDLNGGRWYAFINGRNLTDEKYLTFAQSGLALAGEPLTVEGGIGFKF